MYAPSASPCGVDAPAGFGVRMRRREGVAGVVIWVANDPKSNGEVPRSVGNTVKRKMISGPREFDRTRARTPRVTTSQPPLLSSEPIRPLPPNYRMTRGPWTRTAVQTRRQHSIVPVKMAAKGSHLSSKGVRRGQRIRWTYGYG